MTLQTLPQEELGLGRETLALDLTFCPVRICASQQTMIWSA